MGRWSSDAAAVVAELGSGRQIVGTAALPQPPGGSVLKEASNDGYAIGLALDETVQRLGRDISEASGSDLDETLEGAHEVVCLAFIWYLEHGATAENPAEMETQIELYLAVRHFPIRELPRVRRDLETLYEMARQTASADELRARVAEAVLC